ncbi:hypothetical protein CTI12_AA381060 [Artemisia annua]|uniref:Uncharacterized protein n=1 Tax=Artemisia annua TaxID=35608 RepID=A0A2U1MH11_ARTAN|nr:hypothetical protein CTI12_AA381060 [Artemisia annua]
MPKTEAVSKTIGTVISRLPGFHRKNLFLCSSCSQVSKGANGFQLPRSKEYFGTVADQWRVSSYEVKAMFTGTRPRHISNAGVGGGVYLGSTKVL